MYLSKKQTDFFGPLMKHQWHCWAYRFHFSPILTCLSNLGQKNRTPGWNSWKHVENMSTLHRIQIAQRIRERASNPEGGLFNTCDGWTLVLNSVHCHSAYHKNWTIICSIQRRFSSHAELGRFYLSDDLSIIRTSDITLRPWAILLPLGICLPARVSF